MPPSSHVPLCYNNIMSLLLIFYNVIPYVHLLMELTSIVAYLGYYVVVSCFVITFLCLFYLGSKEYLYPEPAVKLIACPGAPGPRPRSNCLCACAPKKRDDLLSPLRKSKWKEARAVSGQYPSAAPSSLT